MIRFFAMIVLVASTVVVFAGESRVHAEADLTRPHIVLVMADDQGFGDMGYYGHPILKTPHFDEMAKQSLRFDRFYAAAPVCSPTRGSVLTGRHPNRFGCFTWGRTLRPQEITIAEALKTAGYVTAHFGKWHVGSVYKNSPVNPGASGFDEWLSAPNFYDNDPTMSRGGVATRIKGESSVIAADAAIEFLRKHKDGGKPMFAVVWFGSPHDPHIAAEEDKKHYADKSSKEQNFYGEITGMDRAFGKLRNALKTLDIHENTLLWYCSDNGGLPGLGVTGGRKAKGSIYEGGLRVPAMLQWPAKFKQARITEVPCNTVDIYPTLLDIAGVKMKDQPMLDGVSLLPLVEGKMTKRTRPMGFWSYPSRGIPTYAQRWMEELYEVQQAGDEVTDAARLWPNIGEITEQVAEDSFPGHAAWQDWPWKLHRIAKKNGEATYELYNLADDPDETNDVSAAEAKRVATMKHALEAWQTSVLRSLNGKDY